MTTFTVFYKAQTPSGTRFLSSSVVEATSKEDAAEHIADVLAQDNPSFDRARFLKACGIQA